MCVKKHEKENLKNKKSADMEIYFLTENDVW